VFGINSILEPLSFTFSVFPHSHKPDVFIFKLKEKENRFLGTGGTQNKKTPALGDQQQHFES